MSEVSTDDVLQVEQKPKMDVLQKEKFKKEQILQIRYQKEYLLEQNKLKRAEVERNEIIVKEQEVSARSFRAWYEKMHYSLECEKLEPEYKKYQERTEARIKKEREEYAEMQKKLQESLDESKSGITLSSVPEVIPPQGDLKI